MAVHLKTPEEVERMRVAGRLASEVLDYITPHVKGGVTTEELDGGGADPLTRNTRQQVLEWINIARIPG